MYIGIGTIVLVTSGLVSVSSGLSNTDIKMRKIVVSKAVWSKRFISQETFF